jgi:hypothetical protein
MNGKRGGAWLRAVILLEYAIAAGAIAACVRVAVTTYQRPAMCVDTCFEPLVDVLIGLGGGVMLIVGAAITLILTNLVERNRAGSGLPPVTGGRQILAQGSRLAAAGLLVPLLVVAALLFVPRLT